MCVCVCFCVCVGRPYDAVRYEAAVDAACLKTDFELMAGGDLTELGRCTAYKHPSSLKPKHPSSLVP